MKIDRSCKKVFGKRFLFLSFLILLSFITIYVYQKEEKKRKLFESLSITFQDRPTIEYGTSFIDALTFVENSSGKVRITGENLDPMNIGMQEVVLQVSKNGIQRNFSFKVEVKDTKAPEIKIKEETISLQIGEVFDPISNIVSVYDLVDGDLSYIPLKDVTKDQKNYYTYETNLDVSTAGEYNVHVRAVDKHLNTSVCTFTVQVKKAPALYEDPVVSVPPFDIQQMNLNTVVDASKEGVLHTAHALLGSPYASGGSSPSGFDCSGFVFYIYGQNGIPVARTTGGQLAMGMGVSLAEAMPGDILVFGTSATSGPTHTGVYIGGGNMIHAANPRKGVIVSNVSAYVSYGNPILSIRRI